MHRCFPPPADHFLLQWKTFQWGDILANLLGSSLFLYIGVLLRRRARRRSEIAELYQPLSAVQGASYRDAQGRTHAFAPAGAAAGAVGAIALPEGEDEGLMNAREDVWDDELDEGDLAAATANPFSLGDGDDEREERDARDMV